MKYIINNILQDLGTFFLVIKSLTSSLCTFYSQVFFQLTNISEVEKYCFLAYMHSLPASIRFFTFLLYSFLPAIACSPRLLERHINSSRLLAYRIAFSKHLCSVSFRHSHFMLITIFIFELVVPLLLLPCIISSVIRQKTPLFYIGKPSVPPSSFAETMKETVTKRETAKEEKPRPKSVLLPGSPPEIAYAPPRQSYYEGRSGVPYHNAVGTETKKTVHMDESTENTRRIVTVEQTSRVIKFGDTQTQHDMQQSTGPIGHQQNTSSYSVPKPTKFVQGQFRESDYESDADTSRIRAKWAPSESETEEPRYRKVQPPKVQSSRSPIITLPSESETERSENERRFTHVDTARSRQIVQDYDLKPGSPPEFAFAPANQLKKTANRKANQAIFFYFSGVNLTLRECFMQFECQGVSLTIDFCLFSSRYYLRFEFHGVGKLFCCG